MNAADVQETHLTVAKFTVAEPPDRSPRESSVCVEFNVYPWGWYIYLHEWLIFMVNVSKYAILGWYG